MMIAAIAAALVSCQSKGNQNNDTMDEGVMTVVGNDSSAVAVYEGILPQPTVGYPVRTECRQHRP